MRWDDPIFTGTHDKWSWLVVRTMIPGLARLTAEQHIGQRLCITAFDSGAITPRPEERALGWTAVGDVMVSPPVTHDLKIPCAEYDEWYVFTETPDSIVPDDRYVNICGFNLADPSTLAESQDSTWDQTNFDWLIPQQASFWKNIERLQPITYVGSGDADVIVTSNMTFANMALDIARKAVA